MTIKWKLKNVIKPQFLVKIRTLISLLQKIKRNTYIIFYLFIIKKWEDNELRKLVSKFTDKSFFASYIYNIMLIVSNFVTRKLKFYNLLMDDGFVQFFDEVKHQLEDLLIDFQNHNNDHQIKSNLKIISQEMVTNINNTIAKNLKINMKKFIIFSLQLRKKKKLISKDKEITKEDKTKARKLLEDIKVNVFKYMYGDSSYKVRVYFIIILFQLIILFLTEVELIDKIRLEEGCGILFDVKEVIDKVTENKGINFYIKTDPFKLIEVAILINTKGFKGGKQPKFLPLPLNNIQESFKFDTSSILTLVLLNKKSVTLAESKLREVQEIIFSNLFVCKNCLFYPSHLLKFHHEFKTNGYDIDLTYSKIDLNVVPIGSDVDGSSKSKIKRLITPVQVYSCSLY